MMNFNKIVIMLTTYIMMYFSHMYLKNQYYTHCCANIFQIFFINNSTLCVMIKNIIDTFETLLITRLQNFLLF